jgi:hypothetical protein
MRVGRETNINCPTLFLGEQVMALHGWHHGSCVSWASTPWARKQIEGKYIDIIMNKVARMRQNTVDALIAEIKADDLTDKVINNLIENISIKRGTQ